MQQLIYDSEQFAVLALAPVDAQAGGFTLARAVGFEIVDKQARRECFLDGMLAERFRAGAEALAASSPSPEAMDDYLAGYAQIRSQPLVHH